MPPSKNERKWYVVWSGHVPGVYDSWNDCRIHVEGVPGARYKSYSSRDAAYEAFAQGAPVVAVRTAGQPSKMQKGLPEAVRVPSVCVDAACDMTTGVMEYRGVDTETGNVLFSMGPFEGASNNIGEFLAIVHALSLLAQQKLAIPIYTDSRTALAWVRNKHAKTTVSRSAKNAKLFELVQRAESWLKANNPPNPILKWDTKHWGEIPADYGRK
jgi:ribonuclease HI